MAERSSELDKLNDFGNSDRPADVHAAERIADELHVTPATTVTASGNNFVADDVRDLAMTPNFDETNVATTTDATVVTTGATTDDNANSAANAPTDAILDPTAEPEEIRQSIEHTRSEMSETINAIQEKLSISNIATQVKGEVSEQISGAYETAKNALFGATLGKAGGFMEKVSTTTNQLLEDYGPAISEAGTTVVRTARRNPVPVALIGLGIGLLLFNSRRKTRKVKSYRYDSSYSDTELDYDYSPRPRKKRGYTPARNTSSNRNQESTVSKAYNRVGEAANSAYSSVSNAANTAYSGVSNAANTAYSGVSNAASSALSNVSNVTGSVTQKVGNLGTGVKQAASWTQDTFENQLEQNPFAVGAVALALGAVTGLALPSTTTESQLMGEARENLLQKAQEAASGVIDKVQQVAGEVGKTVQEEAKAQGINV